jgi:hypothetical protein
MTNRIRGLYEIDCLTKDCESKFWCTSPQWTVPKWQQKEEFTCEKCKELK